MWPMGGLNAPEAGQASRGRLIFKGGSFPIAECVDNETAAAIAGMSEQNEKMREAIEYFLANSFDCSCTSTGFIYGCLHLRRKLKAALAAGGNL